MPTRTGEIFRSVHPGIAVGTSFRYNQSPVNQLSQTIKLGYVFHQFVQHSVQLYSELEYKRFIGRRISLAGAAGAGYVHIFSATQVFKRDEDGHYKEKPDWGRPQVMGTFALGAGYLLNQNSERPVEIFTRYQFWVEAPFVRQYVPVLPNTALHLGLNYPLFERKNN
ncbi:hypothetical protein AAE02nite_43270 [Adhaeribacter aerolatus]|uniref:Outer membrane protein beta-barrel domain-containing protein n=1 Tax=Adhaeribacter aerolatus TaxID=670289 RepID=A0A512B3X0_9BACT|nr:hypothetical protein AAE02nite_43270 [Adhaeribacter aerolatus]